MSEATNGEAQRLLPGALGSACDGCKYLGHEYKHLQGVHGVAHWVQCNYPLPFYVVSSATPLAEGTC